MRAVPCAGDGARYNRFVAARGVDPGAISASEGVHAGGYGVVEEEALVLLKPMELPGVSRRDVGGGEDHGDFAAFLEDVDDGAGEGFYADKGIPEPGDGHVAAML